MRSRLLERLPPAGRRPEKSKAALVDAEGRSAAAGRGGVGILDRETAARDGVDKVDLGAVQIAHADWIDVKLHAVRFVDLIAHALAVFFDHQPVLEAGTAAALHENPQSASRFVLFGKQLVDLRRGRFRYIDHLGFLLTNWPLYH